VGGFAIQFNKNSFGIAPTTLQVQSPLSPNTTAQTSLLITPGSGPIQKMDPLNNLQVAIKNSIDIFYFSCLVPAHVLFIESGKMDRKVFLDTWKEIPAANEVQSNINTRGFNADSIQSVLDANNIFTIAKRTVEGQDMLYQSLRFTNNITVLSELKMVPGNPSVQLSLKTTAMDVVGLVQEVYQKILE